MEKTADIAAAYFARKLNCAQSVFSAFAPSLGVDEATALKIASPFGGGVARQGEICGAVTGALMAIGLARGSSSPENKEAIYKLSQEFLRRFETRHKVIYCRDLIGFDISSPMEHELAKEAGVFANICPHLVRDAADLVEALLAES